MVNLDQGQVVIDVAGCFGVFSLEESLSALGTPLEKVSFRNLGKVSSSDAPPSSLSPNVCGADFLFK